MQLDNILQKVHDSVIVKKKDSVNTPSSMDDYDIILNKLDGLQVYEYEGI